mgnify:CR=1 FL=1
MGSGNIDHAPDRKVWEFVRGDNVSNPFQVVTVIDGQEYPWDLTGYTIGGVIRSDPDSSSLGSVVGLPDPDQANNRGHYVLSIDDSVTANLPPTCVADILFTTSGGIKATLSRFQFKVAPATNP